MIKDSTALVDDFEDDALVLLTAMKARTSWDKEKSNLRTALVTLLEQEKYIRFVSTQKRYYISRVGESFLYDVPLYKTGYLRNFRGMRVRVVCVFTSVHANRIYMAKALHKSPENKIITKIVRKPANYSFPEYVHNHEVIYKSPRFMVLKINKAIRILSSESKTGYVNIDDCDAIVIDGKQGIPIGTLKLRSGGEAYGKSVGSDPGKDYLCLRDAINDLSKKRLWKEVMFRGL